MVERKPTACIVCSENCGLEILTENGRIACIRGDKRHPTSCGYLRDKASALDYYQNQADRLHHPLRRSSGGSVEEISWDMAIAEIAERILAIREQHGGHALAFYGGAGLIPTEG